MSAAWVLLLFCRDGSLPFMTRQSKSRGRTRSRRGETLSAHQIHLFRTFQVTIGAKSLTLQH